MIDTVDTFERGSLVAYVPFVLISLVWHAIAVPAAADNPLGLPQGAYVLYGLVISLALSPIVLSGLYGGLHRLRQSGQRFSLRAFVDDAKRLSASYLLVWALYVCIALALALAVGLLLGQPLYTAGGKLLTTAVDVPLVAVSIFWFAALAKGADVVGGLGRAFMSMLTNPLALLVGLGWGLVSGIDTLGLDQLPSVPPLAFAVGFSFAMAFLRLLVTQLALTFTRDTPVATIPVSPAGTVGLAPAQPAEPGAAVADAQVSSRARPLSNLSFVFGLLSFVPLFHLVAILLGLRAVKKAGRLGMRTAIALSCGIFFTAIYMIILWSFGLRDPAQKPDADLQFLVNANPSLASAVDLMQQGSYTEARAQLSPLTLNPSHSWAIDCALGISEASAGAIDAALTDFGAALARNPVGGECFYFYGLALLENGDLDKAGAQFKAALSRSPGLAAARSSLELVETAHTPSRVTSAVFFIVILLFLFTVHEYGHAWSAWKLGDDTARSKGRLTLNPVAHLDVFGSLLLPIFLFIRESDVVFGWAKPVPVDPSRFKDPRRDHMRVSFAGPAVNLFVAMGSSLLLGLLMLVMRGLWPETISLNLINPLAATSIVGPPAARWIVYAVVFLKTLMFSSLVLGAFNLLPVPPLDGSWILSAILPQRLRTVFEGSRRFSIVLVLLLAFTPVFDTIVAIPIGIAWAVLTIVAYAMGYG